MKTGSILKYHIALLTANILFGMNYSFYSSIIGRILTSDQLFYLRTASTTLFFVPFMFLTRRWKIDYRDLPKFAMIGLLIIFGRMYLMLYGMNFTSPIDGSIIATLNPIIIMLFSALLLKEKITAKRTIGILLGLAGALTLIISDAGHGGLHGGKSLGNILITVSIIFSAFNTVFTKKFIAKYDPFTILGWSSLIGFAFVVPIFTPDMAAVDMSKWNLEMWGEVGYILVLGTILATALAYFPLKKIAATSASMYAYSQPIAATILAVWRGQDKITVITVISAVLIFLGVLMVIASYRKNKNHPSIPASTVASSGKSNSTPSPTASSRP